MLIPSPTLILQHFTLLPPCDAWALPEAPNLPQAHFRMQQGQGRHQGDEGFEVVLEPGAEPITWIDLEVEEGDAPGRWRWRPQHAPQRGRWRWEGQIHPLEVYVKQGEVLYLPALWCVRVCLPCACTYGLG